MEFNLLRLKNNLEKYINIDLTHSFTEDELEGTGLLSLNNVMIKGEITKNAMDDIMLHLVVEGVMDLPCAITLVPVSHAFKVEIDGSRDELMDEQAENVKKDENILDILPIIWENILMEIPMRVVSPGAEEKLTNLQGEGWKVITEEEKDINPELAKLKDLL
ncbi:MAG: DUF177 domain-containing protein [Firmicutes bacterium]|nr:DUF177 domain-containing protein [Bacillota bacterium]